MVNLETGAASFRDFNPGTASSLSIASAGKDFFAMISGGGPNMNYAGAFWIADAEPFGFASFQSLKESKTILQSLAPTRRYKLESSGNLSNWKFEREISNANSAGTSAGSSTALGSAR